MVSFMFGWSVAAQRGCWKLFHETPTTQSPAADAPGLSGLAAAEPEALAGAPELAGALALAPAVEGGGVPVVQALARIAAPASAVSRR
jgi:hypothetical protein